MSNLSVLILILVVLFTVFVLVIVGLAIGSYLKKRASLKQVPLSPESKKALEEGIRSAKDNPNGIYLGSFSKYKDE